MLDAPPVEAPQPRPTVGTPVREVYRRERRVGFRAALRHAAVGVAWLVAELVFDSALELIAWLILTAIALLVHLA